MSESLVLESALSIRYTKHRYTRAKAGCSRGEACIVLTVERWCRAGAPRAASRILRGQSLRPSDAPPVPPWWLVLGAAGVAVDASLTPRPALRLPPRRGCRGFRARH
jgi:hypothetical protein